MWQWIILTVTAYLLMGLYVFDWVGKKEGFGSRAQMWGVLIVSLLFWYCVILLVSLELIAHRINAKDKAPVSRYRRS